MVDETIINYVPNYDPRNRNIWLIYLPSSGANQGNSKNDFLVNGKKKGKWAFRHSLNKGKFMEKILNIYKGDLVIFVWGLRPLNNTHQRQISIENDWYIEGLEITKVSKGYYCDIYDDTFESKEWKENKVPENKNYIHYFNFIKGPLFSSVGENKKFFLKDTLSNIDSRNEYLENIIKQILWSLNNQGCPSKITDEDYRSLLMHLGVTSF